MLHALEASEEEEEGEKLRVLAMKDSMEVKSSRRCWLMSSRVKNSSVVITLQRERGSMLELGGSFGNERGWWWWWWWYCYDYGMGVVRIYREGEGTFFFSRDVWTSLCALRLLSYSVRSKTGYSYRN